MAFIIQFYINFLTAVCKIVTSTEQTCASRKKAFNTCTAAVPIKVLWTYEGMAYNIYNIILIIKIFYSQ